MEERLSQAARNRERKLQERESRRQTLADRAQRARIRREARVQAQG